MWVKWDWPQLVKIVRKTKVASGKLEKSDKLYIRVIKQSLVSQ